MRTFVADPKLPVSATNTPAELILNFANHFIGTTQTNAPDVVDQIRRTVNPEPTGEAWCADFVQACVAYAEEETGKVSQMPATEGVLSMWHQCPGNLRVAQPQPGDIILWLHANSALGHCGIVDAITDDGYHTIEGNTSGAGGIDRDGGDICVKERPRGGMGAFKELGFIRPF